MAGPFKNLGGGASKNVSEHEQREVAQVTPDKDDRMVNEDPVNEVPGKTPDIAWPEAQATEHKPMKGMK